MKIIQTMKFLISNILSNYFSNNKIKLYKDILQKNKRFRNLHQDKRCFIIGNGASLLKQNIGSLSDEITFVMNAFWKHSIISDKWQPTYYCFADPNNFDGSSAWIPFFKNLREKVKNSLFFVPELGKDVIGKQKLLSLNKTYYVKFENSGKEIKDIDLTHNIPSVQSTSQLAIEIAIYMGCNPIYLMGMDHDWLSHRGYDKHFYKSKTIENHPIAHGDLSRYSYKSELESCLKLWQKYEYLKKIADRQSIKIINITDGGFLDVFPRAEYEDIL